MSFDESPTTRPETTLEGLDEAASHEPDAIRAEIERTRSDLSRDVNALGEAVSPGSIAKRQTGKVTSRVKGALNGVKERVPGHGNASRAGASSAVAGSTDSTPGAWDRTSHVAYAAIRRTGSNPLALGLIALGAGWLLGRFSRWPNSGGGRRR
jgi:hypothetical protein